MDIHITLREVCSPHRTDRVDTATSVDCLTETGNTSRKRKRYSPIYRCFAMCAQIVVCQTEMMIAKKTVVRRER